MCSVGTLSMLICKLKLNVHSRNMIQYCNHLLHRDLVIIIAVSKKWLSLFLFFFLCFFLCCFFFLPFLLFSFYLSFFLSPPFFFFLSFFLLNIPYRQMDPTDFIWMCVLCPSPDSAWKETLSYKHERPAFLSGRFPVRHSLSPIACRQMNNDNPQNNSYEMGGTLR